MSWKTKKKKKSWKKKRKLKITYLSMKFIFQLKGVPKKENWAKEEGESCQRGNGFPRTFQIEKSRWVYSTMNEIKHISRHIIMKLLNTGDKEETPKGFWEQTQVTYKGLGIRITLVSSKGILKAEWQNISQALRKNYFQPKILYPKVGIE